MEKERKAKKKREAAEMKKKRLRLSVLLEHVLLLIVLPIQGRKDGQLDGSNVNTAEYFL